MIIDCHAHVSAPVELWAYKASILSHRGAHGRGKVNVTDEQIRHAVEEHKEAFPHPHLHYIDKVGTKMQLISPRPFQLMHSEEAKLVQWFHEEVNNIIYRETQIYPDRFIGIAGIPTVAGEPLDIAIKELERCVNELGFKGTLLNPDPYENTGTHPPAMGDKYWYPLYEKLCELDVPAHIHGTGSRSPREPYSLRFINEETTAVFGLINSDVFKDFPAPCRISLAVSRRVPCAAQKATALSTVCTSFTLIPCSIPKMPLSCCLKLWVRKMPCLALNVRAWAQKLIRQQAARWMILHPISTRLISLALTTAR